MANVGSAPELTPPSEVPSELAAKVKRRGGSPTIYDVAELAGVAPSTVSRALSQTGRISQKTEAKIRVAAEQPSEPFPTPATPHHRRVRGVG